MMTSESLVGDAGCPVVISPEPPNLALQIRNLSPNFSYQDRNEMLYGLGATSVHNHPYFSVAFFQSIEQCQMVIRLLHQRKLQQKCLRVEYAKPEQIRRLPGHLMCDAWLKRKIKQSQSDAFHEHRRQMKKTNDNQDLITSIVDNNQFSSSKFPKVSSVVINRIENFLLNNEQFYQCVLLLMIHLGLDHKFLDNIEPEPDDLSSIPLPPSNKSSSESELETELTSTDLNQSKAPEFLLKRRRRKRKRLKTGLLSIEHQSPLIDSKSTVKKPKLTTNIEEVFDNSHNRFDNKTRKLLVKINSDLKTDENFDLNNEETAQFGLIPVHDDSSKPKPSIRKNSDNFDVSLLSKSDLISDEDLVNNRVPRSDWNNYQVLKNYDPGTDASHRLYVKNIHRKVTLKDLYKLFAKYIDLNNDQHLNNFGIVYMEKGRMRGQAFVTYPQESQAQNAIKCTNGFCFGQAKDKPIVVVFARTCKARPDNDGDNNDDQHQDDD